MKEQKSAAQKAYNEATAQAWKAYKEARAQAWKAYVEATDQVRKAYQETFEFELDLDLPDDIIEDLEKQMVIQVKQRFGGDYSSNDIADYKYIFKAQVTVNARTKEV